MLDTDDTMDLMRAFTAGEDAARSVAEGEEPELGKLERYALALEALRAGVEDGTRRRTARAHGARLKWREMDTSGSCVVL